MTFKLRCVLVVAAALLTALPAQALVIDDFNDGTLLISTPGFDVVDGSGIVGGERDMTGSFWIGTFSSNGGGNGFLFMEAVTPDIPNTLPDYDIRYDGDDNSATSTDFTALNGVDLTDGGASNAVHIRVMANEIPMRFLINLGEEKPANQGQLQSMTFTDESFIVPTLLTPADFYLPFAGFLNPGCLICVDTSPLDFSQVDYIRVSINAQTAQSFKFMTIDIIDTALAPAVPEPSVALLFMSAGILVLARRRLRMR